MTVAFDDNSRPLFEGFTDKELSFLHMVFDHFQLPMPEKNERLITNDGYIIPLAKFGSLIRISRKDDVPMFKTDRGAHDLILQPLGKIEYYNLVFAIYPGISVPAFNEFKTKEEAKLQNLEYTLTQLKNRLDKDHFTLIDPTIFNVGFLPKVKTADPLGREPVILDLDSIFTSSSSVNRSTPVQDKLYRPLQKLFANAVEGDAEDVKKFWQECLKSKEQGILISDWIKSNYEEDNYKVNKMPVISQNYENHMLGAINMPC